MRYLISEVNEPLTYASSGMLIHSDQFLHPRRCIDTYVLLLIQKGTLCITMDDQEYEVGPNQFLLSTFFYAYFLEMLDFKTSLSVT